MSVRFSDTGSLTERAPTDTRELVALRIELKAAWDELRSARESFTRAFVADAAFPAWTQDPFTDEIRQDVPARRAALEIYTEWEYADDQRSIETKRLLGLVGISRPTIESVDRLNACKRRFVEIYGRLTPVNVLSPSGKRESAARVALRGWGLARLQYHQTTRALVVLDARPARVGFSSTRKANIVRYTREEALELLEQEIGPSAERDSMHARLSALPEEEVLARRVMGAESFVPNLTFPKPSTRTDTVSPDSSFKQNQLTTGQPLLLPLSIGEPLPVIYPLRSRVSERPARQTRRDRRIETEPFIEALHLYRYSR
jgi:hypothetical protein